MKRVAVALALVCFGMFVLGTGLAHGEPTAFGVGWGSRVIVAPSAFDGGLSAIAGGYEHSPWASRPKGRSWPGD